MDFEHKNFVEIGSFSVHDRKPKLALTILFLLVAGVGAGILIPAGTYGNNTIPVWGIILSVLGLIVVHELIHILFMSLFSRGKIKLDIKFSTIAVGSDAYFNRACYITIALAPVVALGLVCLICLLLSAHKFLFAMLLILNFATASGDYILTFYALKQDRDTYFVDRADRTMLYLRRS